MRAEQAKIPTNGASGVENFPPQSAASRIFIFRQCSDLLKKGSNSNREKKSRRILLQMFAKQSTKAEPIN
jgi:hypothetical protein